MNNNFNHNDTIIDAVENTQGTYTAKRKARKKHPVVRKLGAFVLSGALFGTAAGGALTGTAYYFNRNTTTASTTASETTSADTQNTASLTNYTSDNASVVSTSTSSSSESLSVADITAKCMSSIVAITNSSVSDVMTYWGTMQTESESCGSGIIIGQTDDELLIVTNYHVIEDNNTLTIVFSYDEDSEEPDAVEAYVKGYDEDKDLAVIAISMGNLTSDMLSQISIATVGSSDDLALGEQVVAIGNALGYGQSVTTGIVSALNRTLTTSDDSTSENEYIQTDAAINPGNSGGALFNMSGELVGINTAKISSDGVEGMGYAIPISDVYDLIEELMNETTRTEVVAEEDRGYLGISGSDVTSSISSAYGFPEGIYVSSVTTDGAADQAGIVSGNIITKFDGKSVSSLSDLQTLLTYYSAGETVTVTVSVPDGSSYTEKEVSVTLTSAEESGVTVTESSSSSTEQSNVPGTYSDSFSNSYGNSYGNSIGNTYSSQYNNSNNTDSYSFGSQYN